MLTYRLTENLLMSPAPDDLSSLKDDMIAFIEGHGMRRFHGYVDYEEVPSVMWKSEDNPDSWKDFVELAKAASAPFLITDSWTLRKEELEQILQRRRTPELIIAENLEKRGCWRTNVGKIEFWRSGFVLKGFMRANKPSLPWH